MSLPALTQQLQRLTERFARPSADAASVQGLETDANAFRIAASKVGRAASAAELNAL